MSVRQPLRDRGTIERVNCVDLRADINAAKRALMTEVPFGMAYESYDLHDIVVEVLGVIRGMRERIEFLEHRQGRP